MYQNAKYLKGLSGSDEMIQVDRDGATIIVPIDASNSDYVAVMALVDAGDLVIAPSE